MEEEVSTEGVVAHLETRQENKNVDNPIPSATAAGQDLSAAERLRDLQDATLHFFSTASNETLGAVAVGLAASTYFVLGRVGLVLIGVAGGIVLHATWEAQNAGVDRQTAASDAARRRRELGVEVVKRVLEWREERPDQNKEVNDSETARVSHSEKTLDFSDFQPETSRALVSFTDAVIRDYVGFWYDPLIPGEQSFPAACQQTLTTFIITFSNHLSRKRTADPFLDFLANSTSIVIVFLNELATALKASQRQEPEEAIRTYLQYAPASNLANVLSTEQQERKLVLVADDILHNFLDSKSYACSPVKAFLRGVLSKLILEYTVIMCSKPEWINGWIVYLLEDGEPELLNVIDEGVEDMSGKMRQASAQNPDKSPRQGHKRTVSRAEEAMQEAMREAQRLNEMIAEDEARRRREALGESEDETSTTTTDVGLATPTSSDSDRNRRSERSISSSMVFDSEGNAHPSSIPPSNTPSPIQEKPSFITFDQLGSTVAQPSPTESMIAVALTLHNASITILDMGEGEDRAILKQKPVGDLLVQIEPASSRFPGWMISRKYADFESLHETLKRIAIISGAPEFTQRWSLLPNWKGQSRVALIQNLETYLKYALTFERLAESEAMKRFLEKETGVEKAPFQGKNVLVQGGAALENVGKGFINVLGQGGKTIAGGGKQVLGGVQGVFGAVATGVTSVGPKKVILAGRSPRPASKRGNSTTSIPGVSATRHETPGSIGESTGEQHAPDLPPRPQRQSMEQPQSPFTSPPQDLTTESAAQNMWLPPPPSEMAADYKVDTPQRPRSTRSIPSRPTTPTSLAKMETTETPTVPKQAARLPQKGKKSDLPITEEETRVSIELIFAIITELYSLSSAWTIRLSLLSAAKGFLLRPNNPQLGSIRSLLQDSVIDANFSDAGLANHINTLRANTLPTEDERKKWPAELTAEEKEKLRVKARKLLFERGMPQALTSVMGAAASGEALGKVFDCLQVEEVARGLIFALLLQAIRAATQ